MNPSGRSTSLYRDDADEPLCNGNARACARGKQKPKPPANYKKTLCKNYEKNGYCDYGACCLFAHGVRELRGPLRFALPTGATTPPLRSPHRVTWDDVSSSPSQHSSPALSWAGDAAPPAAVTPKGTIKTEKATGGANTRLGGKGGKGAAASTARNANIFAVLEIDEYGDGAGGSDSDYDMDNKEKYGSDVDDISDRDGDDIPYPNDDKITTNASELDEIEDDGTTDEVIVWVPRIPVGVSMGFGTGAICVTRNFTGNGNRVSAITAGSSAAARPLPPALAAALAAAAKR